MRSLGPGGAGCWQVVLCVVLIWGAAFLVEAANPEADHLNPRAVALTSQGQHEEAAALFMQALRLSPNDGVIRRNFSGLRTRWGHRFLRAGSLDQAQGQYQAALDLNQVVFYSDPDFRDATGLPAALVGGGFYHLLDGKIRTALTGLSPGDPWLRAALYHEYTHALIYAITRGNNPPRWVHEGLAVQIERQRAPDFEQAAIRRARSGDVPTLEESPYTQGSVAIGYLVDRYGMSGIQQLLRWMGEGRPFAQAFQETFRMDVATLQQNLRDLLVRGN